MQKELNLPYEANRIGVGRQSNASSHEPLYPPEVQDVIWLLAVVLGWAIFLVPVWLIWYLV